ncbi:MAG: hypothetical protein ACFE9L_22055 [Candidatus Hodarchaeota archaeon]
MVVPVVHSEGTPIFIGKPKVSLRLIDEQTTKGAGKLRWRKGRKRREWNEEDQDEKLYTCPRCHQTLQW